MTSKFAPFFNLFFLILVLCISPAHAVEINDEGAAQLKKMLSTHMENYKKAVQTSGGNLKTDGDIKVEQGDGYYAATLPSVTYESVTGDNVKIGFVAINATPTKNPENWKFSMALPTPILITDKEDETIQRFDIGEQQMSGLWSEKLENFSTINAQYNDIKFADIKTGGFFNIQKIAVNSNLKEEKQDLWSGPTKVLLSNFSVGTPDKPEELTIEEIDTIIDVEGYNHNKLKQAQEKIQELAESKSETGFGSYIFDILKSMGDASTQLNIKNVVVNSDKAKETLKSIGLIQFVYNSTTPKDNNINQSFSIGYSDLKLKDTAEDAALIPQEFKTTLSLENFPLLEVIEFAEEAIGDNKDSTEKKLAATKAMNFLPQKLKDAGTILELKDTMLNNDSYAVTIDGELKADPASKMGGIGSLSIETTGLDALVKELQNKPEADGLVSQLAIFRVISEQKGDKNIARIKLNKEGNITINDKDVSGIMGGGAAR